MKKSATTILCLIACLCLIIASPAQVSGGKRISSPDRDSSMASYRQLDLSGTYTQVYSGNACGLNYVQSTRRLGQRFSPQGFPQPDTFAISGIPQCAVIERAYLWTEVLGYGEIPVNVNLTNPQNTTAGYTLSLIGTGVDVCWNMGATHTYYADVTGGVTGNGNYVISGFPVSGDTLNYDTEGATLMIIYRDPSAAFTGTLVMDHGGFTTRGADSITYNVGGFTTCAASQNAKAFAVVGDMQLNPFLTRFNGGPNIYPVVDWWNYCEGNISLTTGQSSCAIYTQEVNDCYTPTVYGVYFQTTCVQCAIPLSLSVNISPSNCRDNGTASVTVSGGTPPYQITWYTNPVQTGSFIDSLAPGSYRLVVNDNSGMCSDTIILIPDLSLNVTFTNAASSCNTGSSTVVVTNGTGPYTYMWDNNPLLNTATITGASIGTHSLTVTDSNGACADTTTTITFAASTITITQTNTYCNAPTGTATATISGGTPPYTYSWNSVPVQTTQTATALTDTVYTVAITDANGCVTSRTVTIYEIFPQPQFVTVRDTICTDSTTLCHGKAWVTGFTNGIGPYFIQWNTNPPVINDSVFTLCPGPGNITFMDSTTGCGHTHWFYPQSPTQPFSFTTQVVRHVTCGINDSSRVSGWSANAVQPVSFYWSSNPPQTTNPVVGMGPGTFSVTMTDARGCYRTNTITINNSNPLNITRTITPVKYCDFGIADSGVVVAVPSGGSPPYSILWNTVPPQTTFTAHFAQPGVYTCVLTSANGCTESFSTTVALSPSFNVAAIAPVAQSCSDSVALSVQVNGVYDNNYFYQWNTNPPLTGNMPGNFPPGQYIVAATDVSGCTISDTFSIVTNNDIDLVASSWDAACDTVIGGSAFAYVNNGTPLLSFVWNTSPPQYQQGIYGLGAGTYTVSVTDAGACQATDTVMISGFGNSNTVLSVLPSGCGPGTFSAVANTFGGSPPYSFSWNTIPVQTNDTAINLSAGTYICTVTDTNGCQSINSVTIANTPFQVSVSPAQSVACGTLVTLSALCAIPNSTYSWQPGNLSGDSVQVMAISNITYTLTVTNACGTWSGVVNLNVSPATILAQHVCAVSVDTALNRNRIFWSISPAFTSGEYEIQKEQPASSGNYITVGAQNIAAGGEYVDQTSTPDLINDRYRIRYEDTCGNSSSPGSSARTILLSLTNVSATAWDLSWTPYSGTFIPIAYRIYRGTNSGQLTMVGTANATTFTFSDVLAPAGTLYYMVEAELPAMCSATQTVNGVNFASWSNVACTDPTAIDPDGTAPRIVNLFPNPNNGNMTIQCAVRPGEDVLFEITDVSGKIIFASVLQSGYNHEVALQDIAAGLYLYRITANGSVITTEKVIIGN